MSDNTVPPGVCVLLAVADDARRRSLRRALEQTGLQVLSVATPGDALVVGFAERCDVLVVDIEPTGIDVAEGVGLVEWLRVRRGRAVPAIGLASHEDFADVGAAMAGGFHMVLGRLAEPHQVADAVLRIVARRDGQGQPPATD